MTMMLIPYTGNREGSDMAKLGRSESQQEISKELSRRRLLRNAGTTAAAAGLLSVAAAGCSSSGSGSAAAAAGTSTNGTRNPWPKYPSYKFALVCHVTADPFFVSARAGANDMCALLGCSYTWTGSENDIVPEMV